MSESKKSGGRLKRKRRESHEYTKSTYRKALPTLLEETNGRCAYSLQHALDVGMKSMEVDHYDPQLSGKRCHYHGNLLSATRHCNGAKSSYRPTAQQKQNGLYVINPYKEADYGKHLFEDPKTGELHGSTPAGRFHIIQLDLNAPHLVYRRRARHTFKQKLLTSGSIASLDGSGISTAAVMAQVNELLEKTDKLLLPILPCLPSQV